MKSHKTRYILVEVSTPIGRGERPQLEPQLNRELLSSMGEQNFYKARPRIIGYVDEHRFVVRCNLEGYKETRVALPSIKHLGDRNVIVRTIKSSGTIRALGRGLPNETES